MSIETISDTALWVATYRAMESERPDAIFRDPFARRLAGSRGQAIVDLMKQGEIQLVINTPEDGRARRDSYLIRRTAVMQGIPYYTTIDGAQAVLGAIEAQRAGALEVRSLQAYFRRPSDPAATVLTRGVPSSALRRA